MSTKNSPEADNLGAEDDDAGSEIDVSSVPLPDPADGGDRGPQEDYDPARLEVYDRDALAECETVIARGLAAFHEVGRSLLEIRDRRLYRETHNRFEDYLRERWGIDRTYAHRLIQSAKVLETLPVGNTPINESQSRELAPLLVAGQPREVRRVWLEANERTGGKPTAATIRQVRQELTGSLMMADAADLSRENVVSKITSTKTTGIDGKSYTRPAPRLEFHWLGEQLLPIVASDQWVIDSIAQLLPEVGLIRPILLAADGRIFDGRLRYLACLAANHEPHFEMLSPDLTGTELIDHWLALNLIRQHLTEGQRACVAVKLERERST